MEKISGVYTITNLVTGRVYVGSSIDIKKRFKDHKYTLEEKKHRNSYLQRSWDKYGSKCFKFSIVEVLNNPSKEELAEYEEAWFQYYKEEGLVYNLRKVTSSNLGIKFSEESRNKMSKQRKGRKHSEETKIKMSNSSQRRKLSEEEKENLRKINKGKKLSKEHIEKLVSINKGKKLSKEHIEKLVSINKGKIVSKETREKLSKANKGKKRSEEELERMRAFRHSEETKKKIGEMFKGKPWSEARRKAYEEGKRKKEE